MADASIAIITPVFNDLECLKVLLANLKRELAGRSRVSVLVVDDGSSPPLDAREIEAACADIHGEVITLSRNLGHQKAIAVGIAYAVANNRGDIFVVMDADGEDVPADVPRIVDAVEESGLSSIVVAQRAQRSEGAVFLFFYHLYRLLFRVMAGKRISFGNFSAIPARAAMRLSNMSELWLSLPASILHSRIPILEVGTKRGKRYFGRSQMNIVSLTTLGFGAISVFLDQVLTRMILGASALAAFGLVASAAALGLKALGLATPGWVTTVVGLSLVILLGVGILLFVGLALSIVSAPHTTPSPRMMFGDFVAERRAFGAGAAPDPVER